MTHPADPSLPAPEETPYLEFTRLFVARQATFHGFLMALVHDRHVADDLVQELACRMWTKFSEYERSRSFVSWGLGFARFLVHEWRRKQRRLPVPITDVTLEALADEAVHQITLYDESYEALRECLKGLTDHQRRILHGRYFEGRSVMDLARAGQRSDVAVYRVLERAHRALFDCMTRTLRGARP